MKSPELNRKSREHIQMDVLAAIRRHLQHHDRAQYILPTGAGKTRVAVSVAAKYRKVVYLVPNSKLIVQTLDSFRQWKAKHQLVTSTSITKADRARLGAIEALEASEIRSAMMSSGPVALVATYQSVHKLSRALRDITVDLMIFDESHRVAGRVDKVWSALLHNPTGKRQIGITARKRLFQTATAPSYGEHLRDAVHDHLDEDKFGKVVYSMSVCKAVENGLIQPFNVTLLYADSKTLPEDERQLPARLEAGLAKSCPNRAPTPFEMALVIGLLKETAKSGHHKTLAYANRKDDARFFVSLITVTAKMLQGKKLIKQIPDVQLYDSGMAKSQKNAILGRFADHKGPAVVVNCFALGEGADIPIVDSSVLLARRSAPIGLTQLIGRMVRTHSSKEDGSKSTLFLPLVFEHNEEFDFSEQCREAAVELRRPDMAHAANELIAALGGVL